MKETDTELEHVKEFYNLSDEFQMTQVFNRLREDKKETSKCRNIFFVTKYVLASIYSVSLSLGSCPKFSSTTSRRSNSSTRVSVFSPEQKAKCRTHCIGLPKTVSILCDSSAEIK